MKYLFVTILLIKDHDWPRSKLTKMPVYAYLASDHTH